MFTFQLLGDVNEFDYLFIQRPGSRRKVTILSRNSATERQHGKIGVVTTTDQTTGFEFCSIVSCDNVFHAFFLEADSLVEVFGNHSIANEEAYRPVE